MLETLVNSSDVQFRTVQEVRERIRSACLANPDVASFHEIGTSEEGRPIDAVIMGSGAQSVSLMAGAHGDEPAGPETLRTLILAGLAQRDKLAHLFSQFRLVVIPHVNPDGEARNEAWIRQWPSLRAYLSGVVRERPGRDVEFGFPEMRQENRVVSSFLQAYGPFSLHVSLHGMGFSEGAMLLIERHWIERTSILRERFVEAVKTAGLGLHDHNRKGEKGFIYIAPGFTTTPEGRTMRAYFRSIDDPRTEALFFDSSMEFVRSLDGDPLCLVTELPLFLVGKQVENRPEGVPVAYLELREKIAELQAGSIEKEAVEKLQRAFAIQPLALRLTVALNLYTIELGLDAVTRSDATVTPGETP